MDHETGPATLGLNASKEIVKERKQLKANLEENEARCDANFETALALNPNEGDMIEFQRDKFGHWGVFIGEGNVIHVVDGKNGKFTVKRQKLVDVAKECGCRVNNLSESAQKRGLTAKEDVVEITQAAYVKLNAEFEYDFFKNNCEHFATFCRYGEGFSDQAEATEGMSIIPKVGPPLAKFSIAVAGCCRNFS